MSANGASIGNLYLGEATDPWMQDLDHSYKHLDGSRERLFVAEKDVSVVVLEGNKKYHVACKADLQLDSYDPGSTNPRIILIDQEFSWGRLSVTDDIFKHLCSTLKIFPYLLPVVHAFGSKIYPSSDTFGAYYEQDNVSDGTKEYCYLLQCVEEHHRDGLRSPWSVRQLGMYARQQNKSESRPQMIIFNYRAIDGIGSRLVNITASEHHFPSSQDLNALIAGAFTRRWISYVDWLEHEIYSFTTQAHVASFDEHRLPESKLRISVEPFDVQRFHNIQDMLHQAKHMLSTNMETIECIAQDQLRPSLKGSIYHDYNGSDKPARFKVCLSELCLQQRRTDTMIERARSLMELLHNIVAFRAAKELQRSTGNTSEILTQAQSEGQVILELNKKASKDSMTLKTITILTLIYLPASFVSTMLSMGYISIGKGTARPTIVFEPEMWIFGFLTLLLLVLTLGTWLCTEKWYRNKKQP